MKSLLRLAILIFVTASALGQQLHLTGRVESEAGQPIPGITIRVLGMGQDASKRETGEISIPLQSWVRPGQEIEVSVIPNSWVLKNWYANKIVVPDNVVIHLVLVRKGAYSLLSDDRIRALLQEASGKTTTDRTNNQLAINSVIQARATEWGFSSTQVRQRVNHWAENPNANDEDKALAAFYKGDYEYSLQAMLKAKQKQQERLARTDKMIGDSYYMLGHLGSAGDAFEEMLRAQPQNLYALSAIRSICMVQNTLYEGEAPPGGEDSFQRCANYSEEQLLTALEADQKSGQLDLPGEAAALTAILNETDVPVFATNFAKRLADTNPEAAKTLITPAMQNKRSRVAQLGKALVNAAQDSLDPTRSLFVIVGASAWGLEDYRGAVSSLDHELAFVARSPNLNAQLRISVLLTRADLTCLQESFEMASPAFEKLIQDARSRDDRMAEAAIHVQIGQRISQLNKADPRARSHFAEAAALADQIAITSRNAGAIIQLRSSYIDWLAKNDRDAEAIPLLERNFADAEKTYKSTSTIAEIHRSMLVAYLDMVAHAFWEENVYAKAAPLYKRLVEILEANPKLLPAVSENEDLDDALVYYQESLEGLGKRAEADEVKKRRAQLK